MAAKILKKCEKIEYLSKQNFRAHVQWRPYLFFCWLQESIYKYPTINNLQTSAIMQVRLVCQFLDLGEGLEGLLR